MLPKEFLLLKEEMGEKEILGFFSPVLRLFCPWGLTKYHGTEHPSEYPQRSQGGAVVNAGRAG